MDPGHDPVDTAPFRLEHPVEYTYAVDSDVLATAVRTKARLESYGARLLNIAEHIFNEIPSFHRGARAAVRKELPAGIVARSDALEQRRRAGRHDSVEASDRPTELCLPPSSS